MKFFKDIVITIGQLLFKHRILSNCKKYKESFYLEFNGFICGRLNDRHVIYNYRSYSNGNWNYKSVRFGGNHYNDCPLSKNY